MNKKKIIQLFIAISMGFGFMLGCAAAQEEDPFAGQISESQETPEYVIVYNKAYNYARQKQYSLAVRQYKKSYDMIKDLNKKTDKARQTMKNTLLGLGRAYGNMGKRDQAEKYFDLYTERYPNNYKAYLQYGSILEKTGNPEKAKQQYEKAMKANPDSAVAEFAVANNLRDKGKLKEAVKYYKQGLEKDPEFQDGNGWFKLAKIYEQLGNKDEMIKAYEELASIRPEDDQAHYYLSDAYLTKGLNVGKDSPGKDLTTKQRNDRIKYYKKSVEHGNKAYKLNPGSRRNTISLVNSYIKLAEMYTQTNRKLYKKYAQKTVPILKKYIKENPNSKVGFSLLADSYKKLRKYRDSIKMAKKALEIEDDDYTHSILADVYFELGQRTSKKVYWVKSKAHYLKIVNNPDFPYAKGRLKIVEKRIRGEY